MTGDRYAVAVDQVSSRTIVVKAHSEQEARKYGNEVLKRALYSEPEFLGDLIIEQPYIRDVRKLGG